MGRDRVVGNSGSLRAGWSRDRIPVEVKFCATVQTNLGPTQLSANGHRVSFLVVKWTRCVVDHSPRSRTEVNEKVKLYLSPPLGFYDLYEGELHLSPLRKL
jgi:hypothetical protein